MENKLNLLEIESARINQNPIKAFNWDEAAKIIREKAKIHTDLIAEAGLKGDWEHTGGVIFSNGKPTNGSYTYLASNWAKPTLKLKWDGKEQEEWECSIEENERFHSSSEWDERSIAILGIGL